MFSFSPLDNGLVLRVNTIFIFLLHGKRNECARETAWCSIGLHPEHQTNRTYVNRIVYKFPKIGFILNPKKNNTPNKLMERGLLGELSIHFNLKIVPARVRRILKKYKWHSSNKDDPDLRHFDRRRLLAEDHINPRINEILENSTKTSWHFNKMKPHRISIETFGLTWIGIFKDDWFLNYTSNYTILKMSNQVNFLHYKLFKLF